MQQTLQQPSGPGQPKTAPLTVAMAIIVVLAISGSLWFLFAPPRTGPLPSFEKTIPLRMSPAEQEYLRYIQVEQLRLSRAENFLHQEVTILSGELYNAGPQRVAGLQVSAEFSDDLKQVVLRETRDVMRGPGAMLRPGERLAFEISFEHLPKSWNLQLPAARVSYLQLPSGR